MINIELHCGIKLTPQERTEIECIASDFPQLAEVRIYYESDDETATYAWFMERKPNDDFDEDLGLEALGFGFSTMEALSDARSQLYADKDGYRTARSAPRRIVPENIHQCRLLEKLLVFFPYSDIEQTKHPEFPYAVTVSELNETAVQYFSDKLEIEDYKYHYTFAGYSIGECLEGLCEKLINKNIPPMAKMEVMEMLPIGFDWGYTEAEGLPSLALYNLDEGTCYRARSNTLDDILQYQRNHGVVEDPQSIYLR